MGMVEDARDIASLEIEHEFGERTAELYRQYFSSKKPDEILKTLSGLLTDLLGPKQAEIKMTHIRNVLQVYVASEL
ncbi:MAG: hypothetical protein RLZZ455_1080 [Candidatus Parcubacteria bacterium]|jgi:hypothetical protein